MGSPSYMRSVVDRNVVMRFVSVLLSFLLLLLLLISLLLLLYVLSPLCRVFTITYLQQTVLCRIPSVAAVLYLHFAPQVMLSHMLSVFYSGFGGLGVACWPLVPKFAGSNPAEAVGFLGRKNPQHAFLRMGTKAVGPMS